MAQLDDVRRWTPLSGFEGENVAQGAPSADPSPEDGMSGHPGGCLCGRVRFELEGPPLAQTACFCRDCQRATGGSPGLYWVVQGPNLRFTEGEPATFWSQADSGALVGRRFCRVCGAPVSTIYPYDDPLCLVPVGSLDDPSAFAPQANLWMRSAQPWHCAHPGALVCS